MSDNKLRLIGDLLLTFNQLVVPSQNRSQPKEKKLFLIGMGTSEIGKDAFNQVFMQPMSKNTALVLGNDVCTDVFTAAMSAWPMSQKAVLASVGDAFHWLGIDLWPMYYIQVTQAVRGARANYERTAEIYVVDGDINVAQMNILNTRVRQSEGVPLYLVCDSLTQYWANTLGDSPLSQAMKAAALNGATLEMDIRNALEQSFSR